ARMQTAGEDLDLLGDAAARGVDEVQHGNLEPRRLLLDPDDLEDRLLTPRAGLHRVVVGHEADGPPAHGADAGDHAIGRRVGLLAPREQKVFLELGAGIEEELQAITDEELALGAQLLAILDVALLDPGPFRVIPGLAFTHEFTTERAGEAREPASSGIRIGPDDDDQHAVAEAW